MAQRNLSPAPATADSDLLRALIDGGHVDPETLEEVRRTLRDDAPPAPALPDGPNLGDLVVILLATTLAGLRDRLADDGYSRPSDLVAELVTTVDEYLNRFGA